MESTTTLLSCVAGIRSLNILFLLHLVWSEPFLLIILHPSLQDVAISLLSVIPLPGVSINTFPHRLCCFNPILCLWWVQEDLVICLGSGYYILRMLISPANHCCAVVRIKGKIAMPHVGSGTPVHVTGSRSFSYNLWRDQGWWQKSRSSAVPNLIYFQFT